MKESDSKDDEENTHNETSSCASQQSLMIERKYAEVLKAKISFGESFIEGEWKNEGEKVQCYLTFRIDIKAVRTSIYVHQRKALHGTNAQAKLSSQLS